MKLVNDLFEAEQDYTITFERDPQGVVFGFHLTIPASVEAIKLVLAYDYEYLIKDKMITVWVS